MTGRDAEVAANWIFSADVTGKDPGATVYTCMLNNHGGVEADLTVVCTFANKRTVSELNPS